MTKAALKTVVEPTMHLPIAQVSATTLFASEKHLQSLLDEIEKEATSLVPDTSTAAGRKEIGSNAFNVRKSKAVIERAGKGLVDHKKSELDEALKSIDAVHALRTRSKLFLDGVSEKVREPLTRWEKEQEAIVQAAVAVAELDARHEEANHLNDLWDREAKLKAAEDKLKAEQAEQERKDRDEQIRKDAEERVAREAEEALQAERDRADQAERDRVAAEEKAEQDKLDAVEQERVRAATKVAEEKAEQDRLDETERKRAANVEHQREINNAMVAAFVEQGFTEGQGIQIVTLVLKNEIPNMGIKY